MLFSFYVGTTPAHHAHTDVERVRTALPRRIGDYSLFNVREEWGVWEGEVEPVAVIRADIPNDATAQRIAYAMAAITGNAAILVSRQATPYEGDSSMASTARFRVSTEWRVTGNRTIASLAPQTPGGDGHPQGWSFVPDVKGPDVAYLVTSDATVEPVR